MITSIISIGNSRGVRIPKPLLIESGLGNKVELKVKRGEIRILATRKTNIPSQESTLLSQKALATDWNRPEENKAWRNLQSVK